MEKAPAVKRKRALQKPAELELNCEWDNCTYKTYNVDEYLGHIDDHKNEILPPQGENISCQWAECDFVTTATEEFIRHIYYHGFHVKIRSIGHNYMRTLSDSIECEMERISFPDLPDDFRCDWENCNEIYSNAELFYRHVIRHAELCGQGKNPKGGVYCLWESCNKNFQNRYKLRDHLRSHSREKVIACPTCGALFSNRTKFVDHMKRQTKSQNFQCTHCSKKFSTERLLRDHMRKHVNSYKCCYCDMTCPSPSSLNKHILYRHGTATLFTCDICDYTCKTQPDLYKHHRTHSPSAPYKCTKSGCDYSTRSQQCLTNHIKKVHIKDKINRYSCHNCDQLFSRGAYLTSHLVKKHKYRWPSGHSRFRYKQDDDGYFRLQTVRYESEDMQTTIAIDDQNNTAGTLLQLLQDNIVVTYGDDPTIIIQQTSNTDEIS